MPALGAPRRPDVGDEREVQAQPVLFARLPGLGLAGRAVAVREKRAVAPAAAASPGHEEAVADRQDLAERLAAGLVRRRRARGHLDHELGAAAARPVAGSSVGPALGAELGVVAEGEEGVLVGNREQDDVAALAAHAAVGAAPGDVGLAAEAHTAATPITALDENLDPIDEHCGRPGPCERLASRLWLAGGGEHAHAEAARAVVLEADEAVGQGEEGVVLGQPHVLARLPLRPVLAEDDGSAPHLLAPEALDARAAESCCRVRCDSSLVPSCAPWRLASPRP